MRFAPYASRRPFLDAVACVLLVLTASVPVALVASAIAYDAQAPAVAQPATRCLERGFC